MEEQEGFGVNWDLVKDDDDAKEKLNSLLRKEIERVGAEAAGGLARYIKSNDWRNGFTPDGLRTRDGKKIAISTRPRPKERQLAETLKKIRIAEQATIKFWEDRIREETSPSKLGGYLRDIYAKDRYGKYNIPFKRDESRLYLQELINTRVGELQYNATAEVGILEREINERAGPKQLRGLKSIIKARLIPDNEKERLTRAVDEKIEEGRKQYVALRLLLKTTADPAVVGRIRETANVSNILGPADREALMIGADTKLEMLRRGEIPI